MFPNFTDPYRNHRSPWELVQKRSSNITASAAMAALAARQDVLLDRALADTFPASDPVSVSHVD